MPVIFALSRNRIGKAMGKSIRLSIVALHSVDGVHQQFKEVLKLADEPLGHGRPSFKGMAVRLRRRWACGLRSQHLRHGLRSCGR